jgi:nitrate/nitrite transporter NarK
MALSSCRRYDAAAGVARLAGGVLADDPGRRRRVAVGGYTTRAGYLALMIARTCQTVTASRITTPAAKVRGTFVMWSNGSR